MQVPQGFHVPGAVSDNDHLLKVQKNIYGQKQAGPVWNKHLVSKLTSKAIGFTQSTVKHRQRVCLLQRAGASTYSRLYTNHSVLPGPDESVLDQIIENMKKAGLKLTVEGDISDFLGVQIKRKPDSSLNRLLLMIGLTKPKVRTNPCCQ